MLVVSGVARILAGPLVASFLELGEVVVVDHAVVDRAGVAVVDLSALLRFDVRLGSIEGGARALGRESTVSTKEEFAVCVSFSRRPGTAVFRPWLLRRIMATSEATSAK